MVDTQKQLELFDPRPYALKQPTVFNGEEKWAEEICQHVEYIQLELDLFP